MRFDTAGLFWDDTPPPREVKPPPPKREPPPRTWEEPGYLPGLDEARAFQFPLMTPEELTQAHAERHPLCCDLEVFENYFLAAFLDFKTGKILQFEMIGDDYCDLSRLRWVLENFPIITFNGNFFDIPLASLALTGYDCHALKAATNEIIMKEVKPWMVLRSMKAKKLSLDHIDLIEVAPLQASLKIYGGRLHVPRMRDVPFKHDAVLTDDQICIIRHYNYNDLGTTAFLYADLLPQIELRSKMSLMYGVDLRSKSDAQIAEAVLRHELTRQSGGVRIERPEIPPGTSFAYRIPAYVRYSLPQLNAALATVAAARFVVGESGAPEMPKELADLQLKIGANTYQMGIGGLHSQEEKVAHWADDLHELVDRDVTSYYPAIILNQGLYPQHLGPDFLEVYRSLVERRIRAKKEKDKVWADTLKIVVNGSFGKTGSKWSMLYAPDLMVQVTISGQLSLLMLIERLELAGLQVCSANTDGILARVPKSRRPEFEAIVAGWEKDTGFTTEETGYLALFARDVNNYIGIKKDLSVKLKGVYSEKGSAGDSVLSKNPESLICADAVVAFLTKGTPIHDYIWSCRDIRRFISVRTVKGGAVKDGEYLGKAIRWYYSTQASGEIIYAETGNKVPKSDNARPCMELPKEFPEDLNFAHYELEAMDILREIGYPVPEATAAA